MYSCIGPPLRASSPSKRARTAQRSKMEEDGRGNQHKEAPTKETLKLWQREDVTGAGQEINRESRSTQSHPSTSSGQYPPSRVSSKSADPKAQQQTKEVSDTPMTKISHFISKGMEEDPPSKKKPAALKLVPEEDDRAEPTNRAMIEHQNEKRLFKMMSESQETPPYTRSFGQDSDDNSPPITTRVYYEKQQADQETRSTKSQKTLSAKSPKKKFFGMAIPAFRRASSTGTEPFSPGVTSSIPSKAQKVLGTTSSSNKKRRSSKSSKKGKHDSGSKSEGERKHDSGSTVSLPVDFVGPTAEDLKNLPTIDHEKWHTPQDSHQSAWEMYQPICFGSNPKQSRATVKKPRASAEQPQSIAEQPRAIVEQQQHTRSLDLSDDDHARYSCQEMTTHSPVPSIAPDPPPKDHKLLRRSKTYGGDPEKPRPFDGVRQIHQLSQARVRTGHEKQGRLVEKVPMADSMQAMVYVESEEYGSPKGRQRRLETLDGRTIGGLEDILPATTYHVPPPAYYTPSLYSRPYMSPAPTFSPEQNLRHWQSAYNHNVSSPNSPYRHSANFTAAGDHLNPFVTPSKQTVVGDTYRSYYDSPPVAPSSPCTSIKPGVAADSVPMSQSQNAQQNKTNTMREPLQRSSQQDLSEENPQAPAKDGSRGPVADTDATVTGAQQDSPSGGLGITPFLNQQIAEQAAHNHISPAFPYPSTTMPLPLHSSMGPTPHSRIPPTPVLPLSELLTHFHVVHHHLDDIAGGLRSEMMKYRNEIKLDADASNDDMQKFMNENFGDVRSNLNAVEHEWRRSAGEVEAIRAVIDSLAKTVSKQVVDPMKELVKQNTELSKQMQTLVERINKLEKKADEGARASAAAAAAAQATTSGPSTPGHSIMPMMSAAMQRSDNVEDQGQGRAQQGGRMPAGGYRWGGYDASRDMSRHMVTQGRNERQVQYGGMNAYYNTGDPSQQQAFGEHTYYPTGNSYGYMQQ